MFARLRWLVPLVLVFASIVPATYASSPLYSVTFSSTPEFEIVADSAAQRLSLYPLSEHMRAGVRRDRTRKLLACDTAHDFLRIRTKNPSAALQRLRGQITRATGLKLGTASSGGSKTIEPTVIEQSFSDTAVITLLLTPRGDDVYSVTCSYVIDERPDGSSDGTPDAIAELAAIERMFSGDSIATRLPAKAALAELRREDYYRGAGVWEISDPAGKTMSSALVLMLKKGSDYEIGLYREADGAWSLIEVPIQASKIKPPQMRSHHTNDSHVSSIRLLPLDGSRGTDLYLEDGRIVRVPIAE